MAEQNQFIYHNNNFNFNEFINLENNYDTFLIKEPKPLMKDISTQTDFNKDTIEKFNIKIRKNTYNINKSYCLSISKEMFKKLDKNKKKRISNNISAAISRRKSKLRMRDITVKLENNIKSEIDLFIAKREELFGLNTRYDYDKE